LIMIKQADHSSQTGVYLKAMTRYSKKKRRTLRLWKTEEIDIR
jgi:hypothetical protein